MCVEPVTSGGVGTRFAVVSTYSGPRALASFARNGAAALLRPQSEEAFAWHAEQREGVVLFAERSVHGNGIVRVTSHGPRWRRMLFDSVEQGLAYLREDESEAAPVLASFQYLRVMAAACAAFCGLRPNTRLDSPRLLCVGLGTAALPSFLAAAYPSLRVEAVEHDPVVIRAAREVLHCRFALREACAGSGAAGDATFTVTRADGAAHVAGLEEGSLHAVLLDAFDAKGDTPPQLLQPPFLSDCRRALAPGGALVCNLFNGRAGSGARRSLGSLSRRLEAAGFELFTLPVVGQEESVVLVARQAGGGARPGRQDLRRAARSSLSGGPARASAAEAARLAGRVRWARVGGRGADWSLVEKRPPRRFSAAAAAGWDALEDATTACSWCEDD